ncbi:MAG TPA: type II toxin-antitoxin system prevent-host-death family antitoxin [Acidobacteriaceae bacterium]|nr:type II toxin-antitoxin system prevent-host-death family antitoxin [Acidobacteriaceae bacterium]
MGAAKAKAHFLALLDEVEKKRESVLVTKKGRPVAKVIPLEPEDDPLAAYRFGGVEIVGDIISPANDPEDWEYD